jgi:hypothetical protein
MYVHSLIGVTKTMVRVRGGTKSQKKHIKSMVKFCVKKLMPRQHNLDITVVLKDLTKANAYGFCLADPEGDATRPDRPKEFELEIHSKMKLRKILETVAHEMVHVKQYARGELYQGTIVNKHRWQGKWIDKDPDYWDQPWEIEAHGREAGLFIRWAEAEGLGHYSWTHDD